MIPAPASFNGLSVVVPVLNEAGSIRALVAELHAALQNAAIDYEIIYVDDGSNDDTPNILRDLSAKDKRLRVIRHRSRCGQSAALWTGVRAAGKDWVATLDGDGQNDPADIPRLIAAYPADPAPFPPLVSGVRRKRRDNLIRRLSSRAANAVRRWLLNDHTPDSGCSLKLFPREAFLALPYFDHMHRFIPALFRRYGAPIALVDVNHRPRAHDVSKYGFFDRLAVGIPDLIGLCWLRRRATMPIIEYEE